MQNLLPELGLLLSQLYLVHAVYSSKIRACYKLHHTKHQQPGVVAAGSTVAYTHGLSHATGKGMYV